MDTYYLTMATVPMTMIITRSVPSVAPITTAIGMPSSYSSGSEDVSLNWKKNWVMQKTLSDQWKTRNSSLFSAVESKTMKDESISHDIKNFQ